jgi:hypothetical protein
MAVRLTDGYRGQARIAQEDHQWLVGSPFHPSFFTLSNASLAPLGGDPGIAIATYTLATK